MTLPDMGDIAWVDLDDALGTEQAGRRPALILTPRAYHEVSRRAIICPITSKQSDWSMNVNLPDGLQTKGTILVDQIRTIDRTKRTFNVVERVPPTTVAQVHQKLTDLLWLNTGVSRA